MEFTSSLLTTPELIASLSDAQKTVLAEAQAIVDPVARWNLLSTQLLTPKDNWQLHKELYDNNYANCEVAPAWIPSADASETNIGKMMRDRNFTTYDEFYKWSVTSPEEFWDAAIKEVGVAFDKPYDSVFELSKGVQHVEYLPNAHLNIATAW